MAIDGTYAITAKIGSSNKNGSAEISTQGSAVSVALDAPVIGKVKAQGTLKDENTFVVSGTMRVLLKRVTYTVTGRVVGDDLVAVCETNFGQADVWGTRVG